MTEHLNRLDKLMQFPADFVFRVLAQHRSELLDECRAHAESVLQREVTCDLRKSGGGQYSSVRIRCVVESPEEVIEVYGSLQQVRGLRMLL